METTKIHKNNITVGDTIICPDGHMRTVCAKDIKDGGFHGRTIFGDSYRGGTQLVELVKTRK